jgi:CheY-like chemotaxis protein
MFWHNGGNVGFRSLYVGDPVQRQWNGRDDQPAMTGIQLYQHLIDAGRAIPAILVTAYPNDVHRLRVLNDGVVCYLRKPVIEQHLKRCLHAALTSSE